MLNLHGNQQQICNPWPLNRKDKKTTRHPYTGTADTDKIFSILEANLTAGN